MKGPDGLCTDCGCLHDHWHEDNLNEWSYREGCMCRLCQRTRGELRLPDGTVLLKMLDKLDSIEKYLKAMYEDRQ